MGLIRPLRGLKAPGMPPAVKIVDDSDVDRAFAGENSEYDAHHLALGLFLQFWQRGLSLELSSHWAPSTMFEGFYQPPTTQRFFYAVNCTEELSPTTAIMPLARRLEAVGSAIQRVARARENHLGINVRKRWRASATAGCAASSFRTPRLTRRITPARSAGRR
jgi:hypothetical protein